jgi:hypothetical protein
MLEFLQASSGKILVFVAISVSIVPDRDHSRQEFPSHGQISANSLIGQLYSFDSFFSRIRGVYVFFRSRLQLKFNYQHYYIILAARPAKLSPIPKPSQVVDNSKSFFSRLIEHEKHERHEKD